MPEKTLSGVEMTNSGLRKKGDWEEMAEFAEQVEQAVESNVGQKSLEKLSSWRPRKKEAEGDVERKTVENAVLEEKKLEKESNGVRKDFKDASRNAAKAGKKAAEKQNPEEEISEASRDLTRPLYSKLAKFLRRFEDIVYSSIILKFNPYYLDTEDFSVDMKSKGNGTYEMDIRVPGERTREKLKAKFEDN